MSLPALKEGQRWERVIETVEVSARAPCPWTMNRLMPYQHCQTRRGNPWRPAPLRIPQGRDHLSPTQEGHDHAVRHKYIPPLDFINTLMGDEPVLDLPTRYYQPLLTRDDEAAEIVERYGQTHAPEDVYEDIMVPALTAAKRDRELGTITPEDLQFVLQAMRAIVETVELRQSQAAATAAGADAVSLTLRESHHQVRQWGLLDSSPPSERLLTVVPGPRLPEVSPARP